MSRRKAPFILPADAEDSGLHPNWVALATVDFERKIFVKENAADALPETAPRVPSSTPSTPLDGEQVKNFYLDLVSGPSSVSPVAAVADLRRSKRVPCKTKSERTDRMKKKETAPADGTVRSFLIAAQNDDVEKLSAMSEECPRLTEATDAWGWTPLMCAVRARAIGAVVRLVEAGADPDARDGRGRSARTLARDNGLPDGLFAPRAEAEAERRPAEGFCETCRLPYSETPRLRHRSSILHLFCANRHKRTRTVYGIPECNRGYQMLLRTGWDREAGLGRDGAGRKFPVKAERKPDKNGIGFRRAEISRGPFDSPPPPPSKGDKKLDPRRLSRERLREINIRRELA